MRKNKITVEPDEIIRALTEAHRNIRSTPEIARDVMEQRGMPYDPNPAPFVHMPDLMGLLREMAKDGRLVCRTGQEWQQTRGHVYGMTPRARYWVTAETMAEWAEADAEAARKQRHQQAARYAEGVLVERHRAEYDALMGEYLREAGDA